MWLRDGVQCRHGTGRPKKMSRAINATAARTVRYQQANAVVPVWAILVQSKYQD